MAYPTAAGSPAVLAFRNVDEANAFIDMLSASGKVSGPCKVVNVGIRGWLSFGDSLGVKHVALVVGTGPGLKVGVMALDDVLAAARADASSADERGEEATG